MQIISQIAAAWGRRARRVSACLVIAATGPQGLDAEANGWEHTAIPIAALIEAVRDVRPQIRERAAESLGHRHEKAATLALIALLEAGETVDDVRQAAYRGLGKLNHPEALEPLINCVETELRLPVLLECVEALGRQPSVDAETVLLDLVAGERDLAVRGAAISALGGFNSVAVVSALSEVVTKSDADGLRLRAIIALGKTRAASAAQVLLPLLTPDADRVELITALEAVTLIGVQDTANASRSVFRNTRDPGVKRAALLALAASTDNGAIDYALTALHSEDWQVRYQALEILLQLGLQGDAHGDAVRAIVDTALFQSRPLYHRSFDDQSDAANPRELLQMRAELDLLHAYLRTVVAIDPRYGFDLFKRASGLGSVDRAGIRDLDIAEGLYRVRWQALYGIGYTFNPGAEPVLRQALDDPDFRIRAVALRSVGVYGARAFRKAVLKALADPAPEVRMTAAQILGRDPEFRRSDALIALLDDPHSLVRREAALSVGYAKIEDGRAPLRRLADQDQSRGVREAAVYALTLL